jgi:hypothetical protein
MNRHDYFEIFLISVLIFLLSTLFFANFASLNTKQVTNQRFTPIPDQEAPSNNTSNEPAPLAPISNQSVPSTNMSNESATFIPILLSSLSRVASLDVDRPSDAPLPTQSPSEEPLPSTRKTNVFTWIGHSINDSMAQWLFNMGFTDVCIRYVTYKEFLTSASVLAEYGITLWDLVSPDFFANDSSVQDFKNSMDSVLTYRSRFIVDDCHSIFQNGSRWNESQKANFLSAAACYPNNVTLCFCAPEMYDSGQYDFSSINIDLYCTPDQYNSTAVSIIKEICPSLGIYLWIWNGSGINWGTVTRQQIAQTYDLAEQCGANRFIVWMGDENDVVEQGMSLSSLYNYPEWYSFIANCNWSFRN